MSNITEQICRFAAEMADVLEGKPDDQFVFEMKATYVSIGPEIVEPVTVSIEAHWAGGEWKRTIRQQIETWDVLHSTPKRLEP